MARWHVGTYTTLAHMAPMARDLANSRFLNSMYLFVQIKYLICAIQLNNSHIINNQITLPNMTNVSLDLLIHYPRFKMILSDKNMKCSKKEPVLTRGAAQEFMLSIVASKL